MIGDTAQITRLLRGWADGDVQARDELIPVVYETLHRLARHYMAGEHQAATLQPTALVNEAYLRLVDSRAAAWNGRDHFFGVAAHLMRQVLVDHARRRLSRKRGSGAVNVGLDTAVAGVSVAPVSVDVLALDAALEELTGVDERKCRVVELRYFAGCTEEETASALHLSVATVRRDLRAAEAWLSTRLNPPGA